MIRFQSIHAAVFAVAALALCGCPANTCQVNADCPGGQVCGGTTCVPFDGGTATGGGNSSTGGGSTSTGGNAGTGGSTGGSGGGATGGGTGSCVPTITDGGIDFFDVARADEDCDGSDGTLAACVFVAPNGTDDASNGTMAKPMKTVSYALAHAKALGKGAVCLAGGKYVEDAGVTLVPGVHVFGGFDAEHGFVRTVGVASEIISTGTVLRTTPLDSETHVSGLVLTALTPSTGSTIAIAHVGGAAPLVVTENLIQPSAGAAGASLPEPQQADEGVRGADGQSGSSGGSSNGNGGAGATSVCGGGDVGGRGGRGGYDGDNAEAGQPASSGAAGGPRGSFLDACIDSGTSGDGHPGVTPGESGAVGTPGTVASALGALDSNALYTPRWGGSGGAGGPGRAGGGGGGGGAGTSANICFGDRGGGGGGGGAGGCGGVGGPGGGGGGASFGIAVASGTLLVSNNRITTGIGGIGGTGARGGAGGKGGVGGKGGDQKDDSGAGGKGGDGSPGGSGGGGAGGPGGPTACLAVQQGATINNAGNVCMRGAGGVGGAGGLGAPAGPNGESNDVLAMH